MAYLDHDHRERENVRFFAICTPLIQDLWCSPSCGVTWSTRRTSHEIQISSDGSKTKTCDPRMAGGVHKYIWLSTCQYSDKRRFRVIAYPPEVTMKYAAKVEEVKAFCDISQLVARVSVGSKTIGGTYETESVCPGVLLDVLGQIPTRHPF